MKREAVLLSLRPAFAARILDGTKSTELRRVHARVQPGQLALLYSSSPTMALVGTALVEKVDTGAPTSLWERVRHTAGVSRAEYLSYFDGAQRAAGIWLTHAKALERPLPLSELRERWPWFRPPQSYCFLRATLADPRRVASLAPRAAS